MFSILKRKNKMFTQMNLYAQAKILMLIMQRKMKPCSIVCTDLLSSYNVLDVLEFERC